MTAKFVWLTLLAIVFTPSLFAQTYTPPPESAGGWRWTKTPDECVLWRAWILKS